MMTPGYKEWKQAETAVTEKELLGLGFTPQGVDLILEMIEELIDEAYELGQGDGYYNDD